MSNNLERVKEKTWVTHVDTSAAAVESAMHIFRALNINPIVAQLLYSRGYTDPKSAETFIKLEEEMFHNPFDMMDMSKGVERIVSAIKNGEGITIYGDYDVDGVTSVCALYLFLRSKGAKVEYYIPNRAGEGYGVSQNAINSIKENGTTLIITVDTGVTANTEVDYAKSIGIDFVVTDHHECHADLPNAEAVINPHRADCAYPFKELAGVGVVFKLISALESVISGDSLLKSTFRVVREYADLVCIGTIADVMPIKEENRIIVKYGLDMISKTTRVGLAALIEAASGNARDARRKKKVKITSSFVGFTLAPRINAAGRVRTAGIAVELFLSKDREEAARIAEILCEANRERQAEENKIMHEAYEKIAELDIDDSPVIVLDANDWHHGVIGIVSSRITEKYCRPSILVSFEGNEGPESADDIGKGSGRSIKGLNLVEALCYCSEYLVKFGGHELAAGLSVTRDNLPEFRKKINEFARLNLKKEDMIPVIEADMEISYKDINLGLAESIQSILEPFGIGNPVPMFIVRGVNLVELSGVSDGKHSRIVIGDGKRTTSAMFFSASPASLGVSVGDKVDCLFSIDINEWQDRRNEQLIIRDIKPALSQQSVYAIEQQRFEDIRRGATFTRDEQILPDRDDCVAVFSYVKRMQHTNGIDTYSVRDLAAKVSQAFESKPIGYIKLKFILMVFRELNIVDIEEIKEDVYRFSFRFSGGKRDLDKSGILRKLRSQLR